MDPIIGSFTRLLSANYIETTRWCDKYGNSQKNYALLTVIVILKLEKKLVLYFC